MLTRQKIKKQVKALKKQIAQIEKQLEVEILVVQKRIATINEEIEKIQEQCPHPKYLPPEGRVQLFVECADCGKCVDN